MTRARDVATQGGLVLLTPGSATNGTVGASGGITFSAVASVSINNVFSSAYTNYKILMNAGVNGPNDLNLRWRTTTDNSTNNYYQGGYQVGDNSNAGTYLVAGGVSKIVIGRLHSSDTVNDAFISMDVNAPNLSTKQTNWNGLSSFPDQGSVTVRASYFGGNFNTKDSFTGFTLYPTSGNFTGEVKVYGYK